MGRKSRKRKLCRKNGKEKHFRELAIINKAKIIRRHVEEKKRLKAEKRKFIRANALWSYDEEFDTEVGENCNA